MGTPYGCSIFSKGGMQVVTKKQIQMIKKIEKQAYPRYMQQMQRIRNLDGLADYCECTKENVILLAEDKWYLILAKDEDTYEVVDWASIGATNIPKIIGFFNTLKGKKLVMDTRESTSYKFIKSAQRHKRIQITKDETWFWGTEVMHEIECIIL